MRISKKYACFSRANLNVGGANKFSCKLIVTGSRCRPAPCFGQSFLAETWDAELGFDLLV